MNELIVGLGERSYPIHIERGCLDAIGEDLATKQIANRFCIIADETVAGLYGGKVCASLAAQNITHEVLMFPAGEASKNLATFESLLRAMAERGFDRKDGVIALGGGVAGDLAGFVAASYMRGIPFVQIPTTLLAQVDSSIGGKTGVDIPEGKNLVGAFYQPKAVYIDSKVLSTLSQDELLGGIAEVIKYGVIRDAEFFHFLRNNRQSALALDTDVIEKMISTSCRIKAEVVAEDEKESNVRRILNYGHTIGHAVEAESGFSIIHGKAVAIGMVAAARIARQKGMMSDEACQDIEELLKEYGLPTEIPKAFSRERMKQYIQRDKKIVSGKVSYILPVRIGDVLITDEVDDGLLDSVLL